MALIFIAFIVLINLIWAAFILYHLSQFGRGLESRFLSIIFVIGLIAFTAMIFSVQGQINFNSFLN